MIYVGIDWADQAHRVFVTNDQAEVLLRFTFSHCAEGLEELRQRLAALEPNPRQVLCALERKGGLLIQALLSLGYQVYHINPKAVQRYRERTRPSGAKTDDIDAEALATALRTDRHRHHLLRALDPATQHLVQGTKLREQLTRERARILNQIRSALKAYYPLALRLFSSMETRVARAFVRRWPRPEALESLTRRQWDAFLEAHHYPLGKRAERLYERLQAPALVAAPPVSEAQSRWVLMLLDQLDLIDSERDALDRHITEALDEHERGSIFRSLPGAGDVLAARLLCAFAPCTGSSHNVALLRQLAGTAPVPKQSGKSRVVRMRHACQKDFRHTMHQFSFCSISQSGWARAYYDRRRAQGDGHNTALRKLGQQWIRIIVALIRTGQPYDEAVCAARAQARAQQQKRTEKRRKKKTS